MDSILKPALEKSITYAAYREMVSQLVAKSATTGKDQTEALVNYTKLNDRRMKRWDKTVKVSETIKEKISEFQNKITLLVLTESWCGDAAHIMPVINKVADLNDNIDYKVVLRDENPELMDAFLTNGGRSIPKLIMIDNTSGDVVNTFGPRPSEATHLVNVFKAAHGKLTPEFKEDLQQWYNKNKGQNIIEDLLGMLCELEASVCQ